VTLPDLPAGWAWTTVEKAGRLQLGRQRAPQYHSGSNMKPYLRVANVFEDRIDTKDVKQMHFEPEEFERFRLTPGDVLLNEGQTPKLLGRPAIYRGQPKNYAFTNSLIRFQPGPQITPEWALVVFRAHMHSGRFTRESRITTNIAHLSLARLRGVEMPVPPLDEQHRIVAVLEDHLSRLDAAEDYVAAARARTGRLGEAAISTADVTTAAEVPISELLAEPLANGRSVPDGHGAAVLRLTALRSAAVDVSARKPGSWTEQEAAPFRIRQGDLLLSRGNGSLNLVGRAAMVVDPPPTVAFPDTMIRMRPNPRLIAPALLLRLWNGRHVRRQIEAAVRTTAGIYKVNQKQLLDVRVRIPPMEMQEALLDCLDTLSGDAGRLTSALNNSAARSRSLRRSLLDAAVTGRL